MSNVSRRNFLRGTGAAAGVLVAGTTLNAYPSLFGIRTAMAQEMAPDDDLQTIINLAATAELFATTHYLAAINNAEALGLDELETAYIKAGFLAEQDHLELLVSLGAAPVVMEFYVPETLFSDRDLFGAISEVAETTFVGAYLAATRIFAAAAQAPFAVTTAQIAAVEAEHRAFMRRIGKKLATNLSYAGYVLHNVSDAVPVLQPFLDGSGEGFVGPVAPPTADDIAAVRAEAEMLGFDNMVTIGGDLMPVLPYAAM
ncbi:MAG TPA: ferritin-like domain-containing protein [Aggregatilineales bacterium]|nr:ferritin-like domain-containing protein [Aggregatilineales bacterium]